MVKFSANSFTASRILSSSLTELLAACRISPLPDFDNPGIEFKSIVKFAYTADQHEIYSDQFSNFHCGLRFNCPALAERLLTPVLYPTVYVPYNR